jgi:formate dehydrogenase major subunit
MPSVTRRQFLKISAAGLGASGLAVMGFSPSEALAEVRKYKLAKTNETRSMCPYCSVSCGLLIYSQGDKGKGKIIHIEGDSDNPINRGTLCPKGAGLLDFVHSPNRLQFPEYRAPGSNEWKRLSWDEAFTRIARLVKDDRDKNFIAKNEDGDIVNRWLSTGLLASSAATNEAGYLTSKVARGLGMVAIDTQARI